jgi:hypothetical protein
LLRGFERAKTELTRKIEKALLAYAPKTMGGFEINQYRPHRTALEVVAECGATKSGIVDAFRRGAKVAVAFGFEENLSGGLKNGRPV